MPAPWRRSSPGPSSCRSPASMTATVRPCAAASVRRLARWSVRGPVVGPVERATEPRLHREAVPHPIVRSLAADGLMLPTLVDAMPAVRAGGAGPNGSAGGVELGATVGRGKGRGPAQAGRLEAASAPLTMPPTAAPPTQASGSDRRRHMAVPRALLRASLGCHARQSPVPVPTRKWTRGRTPEETRASRARANKSSQRERHHPVLPAPRPACSTVGGPRRAGLHRAMGGRRRR